MTTTEKLDKIHGLHKQVLGAIAQYALECEAAIAFQTDADEAYKKGLDEAWEALKKLYAHYTQGEIKEIFGINAGPKDWEPNILSIVFRDFTASEALAKLRDYEARKKAEDEAVKVGDEVITDGGIRFVVTFVWDNGRRCAGYDSDGKHWGTETAQCRKTGHHFPEIAAVLEQMKGE